MCSERNHQREIRHACVECHNRAVVYVDTVMLFAVMISSVHGVLARPGNVAPARTLPTQNSAAAAANL